MSESKPVLLIVTEAALEKPEANPLSAADKARVNGVYRTYQNLMPWLQEYYDVRFLTPFDYAGDEKGMFLAMLNKNTPFAAPGQNTIRLVIPESKDFDARMKEIKPNHVHVATEGPLGMKALSYCKKNRIPTSSAFHTNWQQYVQEDGFHVPLVPRKVSGWAVKSLLRSFHRSANATMAATQELKDDLSGWGIKPDKVHIVSRGIDTGVFRPYPAEEKPMQEGYLLYVGRLAPGKGAEEFCQLDSHGLKKVVVGTGPLEKSLIKKYPDVDFKGFVQGKDLARYYSGAELFVMPSTTETFGMTVVEALACGTPIVAPDKGGHRPILEAREGLGLMGADLQKTLDKALQERKTFLAPDVMSAFIHETRSWQHEAARFYEMTQAARDKVKPKKSRKIVFKKN